MNDSRASNTAPNEVWFLGPIPPPVTGITVMTNEVLLGLKAAGPVRFESWSPGIARRGLRMRLYRNLQILRSLAKLLNHGRANGTRLYLSSNSGSGLWLTLVIVAVACRLGYQIYLHHHSYAYIDAHDWRMAWIDRVMKGGVHVVHCKQMAQDFTSRYPTQCGFQYIYPSIVSIGIRAPRRSGNPTFCLGHLSNLTVDKGIDLVMQTFRVLRQNGQPVCLKLAGPFHTRAAKEMVEQAVKEFNGSVQYVGAVHGEAKQDFFDQIDVFLFPTRYKHESWGIVLNEALAAGVPTIACARGCTRTVIGDGAGLVVESAAEFVDKAVPMIEKWIAQYDDYREASQAAIVQAGRLRDEGQRTLNNFVRHMFSPTPSPSGRGQGEEDRPSGAPSPVLSPTERVCKRNQQFN